MTKGLFVMHKNIKTKLWSCVSLALHDNSVEEEHLPALCAETLVIGTFFNDKAFSYAQAYVEVCAECISSVFKSYKTFVN